MQKSQDRRAKMTKKKQSNNDKSKKEKPKKQKSLKSVNQANLSGTEKAASKKNNGRSNDAENFPVVGIGASAGGLKAMETFLSAISEEMGAAFVVVTHLNPERKSLLPELLGKCTTMKVLEIEEGMRLEPNVVFICPPNRILIVVGNSFSLLDPALVVNQKAIDSFLISLATAQQSNAFAIILSGNGNDGVLGIESIRQNSGEVIVQSPETAEFKRMPENAIASGVVDIVLPPEKMPAELSQFFRNGSSWPATVLGAGPQMLDELNQVFSILKLQTGHDFSLYKTNTIARRIVRRMSRHQMESLSEYINLLRSNKSETKFLFNEMLIGVTSFFRDPESFEYLSKEALPEMLQERKLDDPIRVWVAGCATGEEAYSLAIAIHECMNKMEIHRSVQVFGTDVDESAIQTARAGQYPASIKENVGAERLEKYFKEEEDGSFVVREVIRDMLVFAPQNLTADPPFTKLDLLSCRNLLIYFMPQLQNRMMPLFHYSLRPGGLLFLGSSETVGQFLNLFSPLSKKGKLFRSIPQKNLPNSFQFTKPSTEKQGPQPSHVDSTEKIDSSFYLEAILSQSDAPPCVIIDDKKDIIYIHGVLEKYLHPAIGKASLKILRMVNSGLQSDLSIAIRSASKSRETVETDSVREAGDDLIAVRIKVQPFLAVDLDNSFMMIHFEDIEVDQENPVKTRAVSSGKTAVQLENELRNTRERLQTTVEELQASNEEMKSTNEELQSTNEELQSSNEELETSKEELQSLNEESETVNSDLQSRIDVLAKTKDDMKNLLDSTDIAAVFLDMAFRIRNYTPAVTDLIALEPADRGRLISNFAIRLVDDLDLKKEANKVLDDLITREKVIRSPEGIDYLMRIRPYRTVANLIDGVVFTFEDITAVRKAEEVIANAHFKKTENELASVLAATKDGIIFSDLKGEILAANQAICDFLGYSRKEITGLTLLNITHENSLAETVIQLRRSENRVPPILPIITENSYLTKDGSEFPATTTVTFHESSELTEPMYCIVVIQPREI